MRWVRGLWPDGNPLRRRIDRLEAVIGGCLLVAFLVGAPLAGMTAWRSAYIAVLARQHTEQAAWHQVTAVLLANATAHPTTIQDMQIGTPVRARWTAPDGAVCTGQLYAPIGALAGSTRRIWVTADGRLTGGPLQNFQLGDQAALAAFAAAAGTGVVVLAGAIAARKRLDRRRLAAWAADWRATGPQWTSRR